MARGRDLPQTAVEVGRVDDEVVAQIGGQRRELRGRRGVLDRLPVELELEPAARADEPRPFALAARAAATWMRRAETVHHSGPCRTATARYGASSTGSTASASDDSDSSTFSSTIRSPVASEANS